MKELIRHILRESNVKTELMGIVRDENIFAAAEMVGGMGNFKKIFKDDPEMMYTINSLKGKIKVIYHSRIEFLEFPMEFEIIGSKSNIWDNKTWPIINLIYDDSNFSNDEKEMFEEFVTDSVNDLNFGGMDIKPNADRMFTDTSYLDVQQVNGKPFNPLGNEAIYTDDINYLHREYMKGKNLNESNMLTENEEDPTQKILNFLLRRYEIEEHIFGDEDRPIIIKMLRIKNSYGQSYSIRSTGSKKEQIRDILDTLMILNVIDGFDFSKTKDNPYAQKAVKAVKMFYDKVMGDKSNMNESKILDKIKSFFGKKPLTKEEMRDERLINVVVRFINETYTMEGTRDEWGTVTIYLTDERGNTIYPPMMRYYPDSKRLEYNWDFARDIHDMIGDDRLLHLDSEMMGKIFEKLFNKKVVKVEGYSRL